MGTVGGDGSILEHQPTARRGLERHRKMWEAPMNSHVEQIREDGRRQGEERCPGVQLEEN